MSHDTKSDLAGKTVRVKTTSPLFSQSSNEVDYLVEDWWDRLTGGSWMWAQGNPAALNYAMRSGLQDHLPIDDEVLYGHTPDGLGHLVHVSEVTAP